MIKIMSQIAKGEKRNTKKLVGKDIVRLLEFLESRKIKRGELKNKI